MLEVKVWAKGACFTRPENKAERVSYDVPTPSAAKGVLEAIFWKPEFEWQVRQIMVLKPVQRQSILRNEVNDRASERTARAWQKSGGGYYADDSKNRAQRHALILRDVAYIFRAEMALRPDVPDPPIKYHEMFQRRVAKGQAFQRPYLGNREFSAFFAAPDGSETPANVVRQLGGEYAEKAGSLSLGRMLFGMDFVPQKGGPIRFKRHGAKGAEWVNGYAKPRFFEAVLRDGGVLDIPPELYARQEVQP